ncbi:MAG TPA: hypothetical protein VK638_47265, partial [Edaphobacter sp.]|nr:hypothetical protein [Edaphobacter sp.]
MGFCKDPSLTSLNKFGYNVVRLPRTGIEPMMVLGKRQSLELLGKLSTVWKTTVPEPIPGPPATVADLEGSQSDKLELSIGLKILANALQGLGAAVPSLEFGFTRARKVQFTYSKVSSTSIAPLEAGSYLASGDLLPNPLVAPYFLGEDGHAFLTIDVLKSDTVIVEASDEHGVDVALDIPAMQGAVGAKIGVKSSNASNSKISFKGEKAITFGFKAFAIAFDHGKW